MKIVKEVVIKASVSDAWSWLVDDESLPGLLNTKKEPDIKRSATALWPIVRGKISVVPLKKISLTGGLAPSIVTSLELSEQGRRTCITVTISGWEAIDPDLARIEMPKISLAWEKRLGLLKKAIELSAQKQS